MESFISAISPLPGYVLIDPIEETDQIKGSSGSFNISNSAHNVETQKTGKVLAIGLPINTQYGATVSCPTEIRVGSIVVHAQYGYENIKDGDHALKLVAFNDLKGLINE